MNHTLPRFLIIGLLTGVSTAMAQSDLSYLFTSRPKYWFSAGINIRSGGPSVKFSHLGSLPRALYDSTSLSNVYDDGSVGADGSAARTDENLSTTKFNSDHTRYQTFNSDGTVFADEKAFVADQTRYWSVTNGNQVTQGATDGEVDFHFLQARETGARAGGGDGGTGDSSGKSSGGFDLQLSRDIALIGKRASWGISFSIGMNDINSKMSKTVTADLETYTASYKLYGTLPSNEVNSSAGAAGTTYYSAPNPSSVVSGGGGVEDTVTLSATALAAGTKVDPTDPNSTLVSHTGNVETQGAASVTGTWKIKGAYYLMRLGPSFRYYVNKHVSLSGDLGVAGAYVGSDFSIDETMDTPKITTLTDQPVLQAVSHKREFKVGAFAEVNAEYWITFRTGLYAGAVYESLGHYRHEFADAVADVDIGNGLSFRLGLITRF